MWVDNIPCHQRNGEIVAISIHIRVTSNLDGYLTSGSTQPVRFNVTSEKGLPQTFNLTWFAPGFHYSASVAAVNSLGHIGIYGSESAFQLQHYNGKVALLIK